MITYNRSAIEHIFLIFFVYLFNFTLCVTSDSCIVQNSCKCIYENGTGIDLNAIKVNDFFFATKPNVSYFFSPCKDTKNLRNLDNECSTGTGYSLCERNETANATLHFTNLGKTEDSQLKILSNSEAYLIYNRGNIQTTITLICTNSLETYLYVPVTDTDLTISTQKNLILFSPKACLSQLEPSQEMSTGSVLIILFFGLIGTYLFIGILYRMFVAGASGIEVIPNLEFWRDLPSLVMDGVKFIQNGCKVDPLVQTNQDSYDAI